MMFPTIHLNGTSKEVLLDQNLKAAEAIRDAMLALQQAAPNARDYYPQGDQAYFKARREYEARLDLLNQVLADQMAIVEAIDQL